MSPIPACGRVIPRAARRHPSAASPSIPASVSAVLAGLAILTAQASHAATVFDSRDAYFASRPGALFRADDVFAPVPFLAPGDRDRLTYYWEGKSGQLMHRVVARGTQLSLDGLRFDLGRAWTAPGEAAVPPDFSAGARFYLGSQYACLELENKSSATGADPSATGAQVYLLRLQPANARRAFRLPGLFASCTGIWRNAAGDISVIHATPATPATPRNPTGQAQGPQGQAQGQAQAPGQPASLTLTSFRLRANGFVPEGRPAQAELAPGGRLSIAD